MIRVLSLHLGFHTFWVLLYYISLRGVFILIPFVGWYDAFVLGFLGASVLATITRAMVLGYIVFLFTGLFSGWLISLLRTKLTGIAAVVSLCLTVVLLVSLTMVRYRTIGVSGLQNVLPLPATTGRADADQMSMALKDVYLTAGEVPPYFAGKGSTIPLSEIQSSLPLLSKDFQLQGARSNGPDPRYFR